MNNGKDIEDFLLAESQSILGRPCHCENKQTGGKWDIYPITVAQMIEINPYLSKIAKSDFDEMEEKLLESEENIKFSDFLLFYNKYGETINKVVEIIVGEDISKKATYEDYLYMFIATIYRTNTTSFLKSIGLAKNLSLSTKAELIAAEKRYSTSLSL